MRNDIRNRVMIVSASDSFLAKSLISKIEANGQPTFYTRGNEQEIEARYNQIGLIILFMSEEIEQMTDTILYIKDMAHDIDRKIILIGDDEQHEIVEKLIPETIILDYFRRPLIMEDLLKCISSYMARHMGTEKKKTILIVDDDITYMRTVYEWLKEKYHVGMASNAVQAISYLARNKADLVLLDYEMPVANGPQVLQMLKNDSETGSIPVMFLTGHSDRESVLSILNLNPVDYLLKTIDKASLLNKLKSFFEQTETK